MTPNFETVPMQRNGADLSLFKDCFDRNGSSKRLDALNWMYFDNPTGRLLVTFAKDKAAPAPENVAGIYSVLPVRFRIDGKVVDAAQSLDTLTDSRYRGKGLFTHLAKEAFDRCQREGLALIYGFPNGNSAHGFFNKLDWHRLDPLPFLFKPLRTGYFLRKLPVVRKVASYLPDFPLPRKKSHGEAALEPLERFDSKTDELWHKFAKGFSVSIERDKTYLNWRFVDKPGERYQRLVDRDAHGNPRGFVVYTAKEKHGGKIGYLMELLFDPAQPAVAERLLRRAVDDLAQERCDVILAWNLPHSSNHDAFRRCGFFDLPEKLRPIELHFGVRDFSGKRAATLNRRENWYVSYADSDTV